MPRRRRGWLKGACYHVTHRCHGGEYLFRFSKYRDFYVRELYQASRRFRMDVLDYMVTSNHVHLLLASRGGDEISNALRYLHGRIGQWHNTQRGATGAFWGDRFHSTRIQDGEHLGRCLLYIDLNMVRAGAVKHPREWPYCAYHEFYGRRRRYRIVNMRRLLRCLMIDDEKEFRDWHSKTMKTKLRNAELRREMFWSHAAAVGDQEWLKNIRDDTGLRRVQIVNEGGCTYLIGKKS